MIAVIFEVEPAEGRFDEYLDHAARLKPFLEKVPGFISVERFRRVGCHLPITGLHASAAQHVGEVTRRSTPAHFPLGAVRGTRWASLVGFRGGGPRKVSTSPCAASASAARMSRQRL
jgi:Antibiotic biosynthesis monooxygenase